MIKIEKIAFCALSFLFISCSTSSKLTREGYVLDRLEKQSQKSCKVYITSNAGDNVVSAKKLGSIKATDPGMGLNCQEDYVIGQFISDACALNANVINITSESQPNFWSTCYRAKADLLLIQETDGLKTDPKYHPNRIAERSKLGHKKTKAALNAGAMGGIFGAIVTN